MRRPAAPLLLTTLLAACGGDPELNPPTSRDASGSISDLGGFDAALPDVQIPFDIRLPDGAPLPDGFFADLPFPPDRPAADVSPPTDGPRSAYTCPTTPRIRRVAQPTTTQNLGPLGTMTVYQAPASVARSMTGHYYVAQDAMGWAIRHVDVLWASDTVVLRTSAPVTHVAEVGRRIVFRPAGDDSPIESVDLRGQDRRVEFQHVAIPDGLNERTLPFGSSQDLFVFGVRTVGGARGDRYLLLRKRADGPEEVIFSRRIPPGGASMPPIAMIGGVALLDGVALIATTRADGSTTSGLLQVPLDRAALSDPSAMQNDAALVFVPNATLFGNGDGPPGVDCAGSCVALAAGHRALYCVRLSGCAPDNAPSLRFFHVPNRNDASGLTLANSNVFDLPRMVGARGPAQVGRIVETTSYPGVMVLMNLPAPGPGRTRHDLLAVGPGTATVTPIACDLPTVRAFTPEGLSVIGANEPDMWWGVWSWGSPDA